MFSIALNLCSENIQTFIINSKPEFILRGPGIFALELKLFTCLNMTEDLLETHGLRNLFFFCVGKVMDLRYLVF